MINLIISFIALIAASYQDMKIQSVTPLITYSLIIIGTIYSIFFGLWINFAIAAAIFIFLYILNYFGGIGGGDVKLVTGIILLIGKNPINFSIVLMILSCFFGILLYFLTIKRNKGFIPFIPAILISWIITTIAFWG